MICWRRRWSKKFAKQEKAVYRQVNDVTDRWSTTKSSASRWVYAPPAKGEKALPTWSKLFQAPSNLVKVSVPDDDTATPLGGVRTVSPSSFCFFLREKANGRFFFCRVQSVLMRSAHFQESYVAPAPHFLWERLLKTRDIIFDFWWRFAFSRQAIPGELPCELPTYYCHITDS